MFLDLQAIQDKDATTTASKDKTASHEIQDRWTQPKCFPKYKETEQRHGWFGKIDVNHTEQLSLESSDVWQNIEQRVDDKNSWQLYQCPSSEEQQAFLERSERQPQRARSKKIEKGKEQPEVVEANFQHHQLARRHVKSQQVFEERPKEARRFEES